MVNRSKRASEPMTLLRLRDHPVHQRIKVSTSARRLKSTLCSDGGRPPVADQNRSHLDGCALFTPFHGLVIGANHRVWVVNLE